MNDTTRGCFRTIDEAQEVIGKWATETFTHDARKIIAHLQEKVLKVQNANLNIRDHRKFEGDVAGAAVLLLSLCDYLNIPLSEILWTEHQKNLGSEWEVDDTGLAHRKAP